MVTISGEEVPLGGDIILEIEGIPMGRQTAGKIRDAVSTLSSGRPFKVTILRAGQVMELTGQVP
jgi:S1-C subfamily serine protease